MLKRLGAVLTCSLLVGCSYLNGGEIGRGHFEWKVTGDLTAQASGEALYSRASLLGGNSGTYVGMYPDGASATDRSAGLSLHAPHGFVPGVHRIDTAHMTDSVQAILRLTGTPYFGADSGTVTVNADGAGFRGVFRIFLTSAASGSAGERQHVVATGSFIID
jgi:hypothetical protein